MSSSTSEEVFNGLCIIIFYENGLFQGHLITKSTFQIPFRMAGRHMPDFKDPHFNDCMEPQDYYQVLIQGNTKIDIMLSRQKGNDASGFTSLEEQEYSFVFETNQFLSGQQALDIKQKYFPRGFAAEDVIVCTGDAVLLKLND